MSIVTRKPSNFFNLAISLESDIDLPLSPICLFLTYAVYCEEIKFGIIFLSFSERAFDVIFKSIFNKEMGVQFFMNLLSLSFSVLT